jgi:uncharacterized membrane-anchored protein
VETLFWLAILVTQILGDAFSDFLSDASGLGFVSRVILLVGLLTIPALCYYFTKVSRVLLFWLAFTLARPFGSMLSDALTKTRAEGGLDLDIAVSSAIFTAILIAFLVRATVETNKSFPAAGSLPKTT